MSSASRSRLLRFTPPFDWAWLLGFYAARAIPGVEAVAAGEYRRTARVRVGRRMFRGWLRVTPSPRTTGLRLTVSDGLAPAMDAVAVRVRRQFDLGCAPARVRAALGPLMAPCPGIRLPGAFDGFETVVRAILGQQITVTGASTVAGRLAAALGRPATTPFPELTRYFPAARALASADATMIGKLGIVRTRVRAIQELAAACARGRITLTPAADVPATLQALVAIHGIGDWTAQYAAMRALHWSDAFPAADLGVLQALAVDKARAARDRAERWRPYRAYATLCLWHRLGGDA